MSAKGPGKQPYEAPSLEVIDLTAEEVLAPGCKLPNPPGGGPFDPNPCFNQFTGQKCTNAGS
jgi:hypothetical protein